MIGFLYAVIVLLTGAVGLLCGGLLGARWVDWYRVSSFEGGSGYFVVGLGLAGGLLALIIALVTLMLLRPRETEALWLALAAANGSVLALGLLLLAISWLHADIPPTSDGHALLLEVELRLPVGSAAPDLEQATATLHSVSAGTARASHPARFRQDGMREEAGRWILPVEVLLFTQRGDRFLAWTLAGRPTEGFRIPVPARPGRGYRAWSAWLPQPPAGMAPWPEDRASYRFRLRPQTKSASPG